MLVKSTLFNINIYSFHDNELSMTSSKYRWQSIHIDDNIYNDDILKISYLIPMLVKSTLFNINIYSFHDNKLSMTSSKYRWQSIHIDDNIYNDDILKISYLIPMLVKSTLFNINIYSFHDNELSMTSSKYRWQSIHIDDNIYNDDILKISYLIPMLVKSTLFNINIYSFHDNELSMTSSKYRWQSIHIDDNIYNDDILDIDHNMHASFLLREEVCWDHADISKRVSDFTSRKLLHLASACGGKSLHDDMAFTSSWNLGLRAVKLQSKNLRRGESQVSVSPKTRYNFTRVSQIFIVVWSWLRVVLGQWWPTFSSRFGYFKDLIIEAGCFDPGSMLASESWVVECGFGDLCLFSKDSGTGFDLGFSILMSFLKLSEGS